MNSVFLRRVHSRTRNLCRFCSTSKSPFWTTLNSQECHKFLDTVTNNFYAAKSGNTIGVPGCSQKMAYWEKIVQSRVTFDTICDELKQLEQLMEQEKNNPGLCELIAEDRKTIECNRDEAMECLANAIVPADNVDLLNKCQMEFSSGAGGTEAMLFTSELMEMYRKLCVRRNWQWTTFESDAGMQGGVRFALVAITGQLSYATLRFEAGVHRVQRIPVTDKSRIHTSTVSISVLPEPDETQVDIPPQDVSYEAIRASGPGGQNVNKRSSAVRLTHHPSGIKVHCMDERFQHQNLQIAFQRLGAILLQQKVDEQQGSRTTARRLQVGSKARSEKVRTFNYKDDRITDHRLRLSINRIEDFLAASDGLDTFLYELDRLNKIERLTETFATAVDTSV